MIDLFSFLCSIVPMRSAVTIVFIIVFLTSND